MSGPSPRPRTLYDKIVDARCVAELSDDGLVLLYVDRTVINEYTSPQAFSGLREAGRPVWRPRSALAVVDHVNPTAAQRSRAMPDEGAARQVDYLQRNAADFGIELFDVLDRRQGIEHVVAPEQGLIQPGMVIAAGDSHTTTYGAFGALGGGPARRVGFLRRRRDPAIDRAGLVGARPPGHHRLQRGGVDRDGPVEDRTGIAAQPAPVP